jgi:hypothetical protein
MYCILKSEMYFLQHLIRLLNVLSAFPAVFEVLANKPLPSKAEYGFREIPTTIVVCLFKLHNLCISHIMD